MLDVEDCVEGWGAPVKVHRDTGRAGCRGEGGGVREGRGVRES
jgi:hypothetical protein